MDISVYVKKSAPGLLDGKAAQLATTRSSPLLTALWLLGISFEEGTGFQCTFLQFIVLMSV